MPSRKPTVAIVEDDRETARIWMRKLKRAGFKVVGVFASAKEAWKQLGTQATAPDAILLDWELIPGPNGDWLLDHFIKSKLPTRILVVTSHDYGTVQTAAFAHGAQGFLGKPVALSELVSRLNEMLQGKVPLSTHNGEFLKKQVCASPCAAWQKLSPQQQRIVALLAQGKGNKEVWNIMERSKGTIEKQIRRIFDKLKTRDMKRVIAMCAEALRTFPTPQAPPPPSLKQAA